MDQSDSISNNTAVRGKVALDPFLADIDEEVAKAIAADLSDIHRRLDFLLDHLGAHPDLAAQTTKLRDTLPSALATAPLSERTAAAGAGGTLAEDLKSRWIHADDPPLVGEIDDHLGALKQALERLQRPDAAGLRAIAQRMDRLGAPGRQMEGIERRLRPWAILGSVLFLLGLFLLVWPTAFGPLPPVLLFWLVLLCFCFMPGLAAYYAFRTLPRTRADNEIDRLNRAHFLPHGGIYFPEGTHPAGVVLVEYTPPEHEPGDLPIDPRKQDHRTGLRR